MAREILGHMECPECGGAAEVKKTKAGLAYRWCLDCHAQYFPRTAEASDRLLQKCGAAKPPTVTATAPAPAPSPAPAAAKPPAATPAPAPKAKPPATPRNGLTDALAILGVK